MPRTKSLHAAARHLLPPPLWKVARAARRWFPKPESVLLFAFPAIALPADLRARYDRSARAGMPAHITLIYPFLRPTEVNESVLATLQAFFDSRQPFEIQFNAIAGFPGVIYLVPEPSDGLVEIVNALVDAFPQAPPYRGAFQSVIPHLTLAEATDPAIQDRLMKIAAEMLPITVRVHEACLLERSRRRWKTTARFALSRSTERAVTENHLRPALAS